MEDVEDKHGSNGSISGAAQVESGIWLSLSSLRELDGTVGGRAGSRAREGNRT